MDTTHQSSSSAWRSSPSVPVLSRHTTSTRRWVNGSVTKSWLAQEVRYSLSPIYHKHLTNNSIVGTGFQGGILVVQTVLPLSDVPIGTTAVQFFQTLGGALFVSVAQAAFSDGIISGLKEHAPTLNPELFINSGATSLRRILKETGQEDQLEGVLKAYVRGLSNTFWIAVACAICAFISACTLQWKSVKHGHGQSEIADVEAGISTGKDKNTTTTEPGLEASAEGALGNGAAEDPEKARAVANAAGHKSLDRRSHEHVKE